MKQKHYRQENAIEKQQHGTRTLQKKSPVEQTLHRKTAMPNKNTIETYRQITS